METGCVFLLSLPFILGRKEAHPTPTLLPLLIFFEEKSGPHAPEERKVL